MIAMSFKLHVLSAPNLAIVFLPLLPLPSLGETNTLIYFLSQLSGFPLQLAEVKKNQGGEMGKEAKYRVLQNEISNLGQVVTKFELSTKMCHVP